MTTTCDSSVSSYSLFPLGVTFGVVPVEETRVVTSSKPKPSTLLERIGIKITPRSFESENIMALQEFVYGNGDYNEVFHYILKLTRGNYHDSEDIISETRLNVWNRITQYNPSRNYTPWLYSVAINACLDYKRKAKRWKHLRIEQDVSSNPRYQQDSLNHEPTSKEPSLYEIAAKKEDCELIREALNLLKKEEEREVIELVYFQGLKYREVAEILEIPIGTVKSKLSIAKKNLREKLERYNSEN